MDSCHSNSINIFLFRPTKPNHIPHYVCVCVPKVTTQNTKGHNCPTCKLWSSMKTFQLVFQLCFRSKVMTDGWTYGHFIHFSSFLTEGWKSIIFFSIQIFLEIHYWDVYSFMEKPKHMVNIFIKRFMCLSFITLKLKDIKDGCCGLEQRCDDERKNFEIGRESKALQEPDEPAKLPVQPYYLCFLNINNNHGPGWKLMLHWTVCLANVLLHPGYIIVGLRTTRQVREMSEWIINCDVWANPKWNMIKTTGEGGEEHEMEETHFMLKDIQNRRQREKHK